MRRAYSRFTLLSASLLLTGCATLPSLPSNRYVEFLPCIGHPAGPNGDCIVSVRGLVSQKSWLNRWEPEILDFMEVEQRIPDAAQRAAFDKRFGVLLNNHPGGSRVALLGGGGVFLLAASDAHGHIHDEITITKEQLKAMGVTSTDSPATITLRVYTAPGDHREFVCRAYLLPDHGTSVISDIDDTLRITDVNNTRLMLRHTLVDPFNAIEGMPEVYTAWAAQGASIHYLSESPEVLVQTLIDFTSRMQYPEGSFHLRPIVWSRRHLKALLTLLQAPPEFKIEKCDEIITALPHRRYVLVGDTAQHDPEVYGEVARRHPEQVSRILIHNVTCEAQDDPRFREAFRGVAPGVWRIYKHPAEIRDTVAALKTGSPVRLSQKDPAPRTVAAADSAECCSAAGSPARTPVHGD